MPEVLLDSRELQRKLRLGETKTQRLLRAWLTHSYPGVHPRVMKINRRYRVREVEVDAFIRANLGVEIVIS